MQYSFQNHDTLDVKTNIDLKRFREVVDVRPWMYNDSSTPHKNNYVAKKNPCQATQKLIQKAWLVGRLATPEFLRLAPGGFML